MYTGLYAMITTLMPHLRIGPYKEGVLIAQIQMPFHAVGRSFPYELLILYIYIYYIVPCPMQTPIIIIIRANARGYRVWLHRVYTTSFSTLECGATNQIA